MRISDRTAAVKWSDVQHVIGLKAEKTVHGDEAESEDLPANCVSNSSD